MGDCWPENHVNAVNGDFLTLTYQWTKFVLTYFIGTQLHTLLPSFKGELVSEHQYKVSNTSFHVSMFFQVSNRFTCTCFQSFFPHV